MCGISGAVLSPTEAVNANIFASALLLNIEERGRDATGAAWFDKDGVLMTQKAAMPARWFVQNFQIPEEANTMILHTRAATQGSEKDNNNNHPVITGGIVGVHNGVLWNDDKLFRDLGIERIAEVDTEAAFAAIAYGTQVMESGKPRLASDLKGVLESIEGSAALAWTTVGRPGELHLARVSQSPLVVARTKGGSMVFASTLAAIKAGLAAAKLELKDHAYIKEGVYLRYEGTELVESWEFDPPCSYTTSYSYHGTSSYSWRPSTSSSVSKPTSPVTGGGTAPFKGWLRPVEMWPHLNAYFTQTPVKDEETHHTHYLHREKAIDRFLDAGDKSDTAETFGALYRVGDEVITDLPGHSGTLPGHIVMMPQSFPQGEYVIRVMVPNPRYKDGVEPVMVMRELNEFISLGDPEDIDEQDLTRTDESMGAVSDEEAAGKNLSTVIKEVAEEMNEVITGVLGELTEGAKEELNDA